MQLLVEISAGELIDKITILEIKLAKIADKTKRSNISRELQSLTAALPKALSKIGEISDLRRNLKTVNAELWFIEDEIRAQERAKQFGAAFIDLARSVYLRNDRRAAWIVRSFG